NNRITDIHDAKANLVVHNQYDQSGRVSHQDLADGSSYNYAYTLSTCPNPPGTCVPAIIQTDLTDRRGTVRRVQFNAQGRVIRNTFAAGLAGQQVVQYEFTNDQLTATIDALN